MLRMRSWLFVLVVSVSAVPRFAAADDEETNAEPDDAAAAPLEETPLNYVQRPITLRQGTLRADAAPADFALMDSGEILGPVGDHGSYGFRFGQTLNHIDDPFVGEPFTAKRGVGAIGIGAAYGLTNGFEVGALLLPLVIDGSRAMGNLAVYARGRLTSGTTSTALQVTVSAPTGDDLGLALGVPINVLVGGDLRLEIGLEGEVFLDTENDASRFLRVNADVPFAANWQIKDAAFLGMSTGVTMVDIGAGNRLNDFYLPVGMQGGYSFVAGPMLLDVKLSARYTFIVTGEENERPASWMVMLGANAHFDL